MQSFNGMSSVGKPLSSDELLFCAVRLRKLEKKHFRQAVKSLETMAVPLPCSQNLKQYQKDRREKKRLQDKLQEASGVKQTVNPLQLRKAV